MYYEDQPRRRRGRAPRRAKRQMPRMMQGKLHYWIYAQRKDGHWGLYNKPSDSREEATRFAYEKCDTGNWKIFPLPTRNPASASQMIKAQRLEKPGATFTSASERLRHFD